MEIKRRGGYLDVKRLKILEKLNFKPQNIPPRAYKNKKKMRKMENSKCWQGYGAEELSHTAGWNIDGNQSL